MLRSQGSSRSAPPRGFTQALKVRRRAALSIHVQLLEQLKHHIEERTWGAGTQLPPAQHLAGSLGVNTNTVRAVYRELEREGYVVSEQGRGTFIAPDSPASSDEHQHVNDLLDEVAVLAQHLGLSPDDIARLAFLRARVFTPQASSVRMLFVECSPWDLEDYGRILAERTGIQPKQMLVRDLPTRAPDFSSRFDLIVTTLFHVDEVQRAVGRDRNVVAVMLEPSFQEVVARMLPLRRGTRVAIICSTRDKASKFVSSLLACGLNHLRFLKAGLDDKKAIVRVFQQADQVWVSSAFSEIWKDPLPADKPVFTYVQRIDATSLRLLRRVIAEFALRDARKENSNRRSSAG